MKNSLIMARSIQKKNQKSKVSPHVDKEIAANAADHDVDDHYESIADAILAKKRKMLAEGGEVEDGMDIEKMDEDDQSQEGFRKPISIEEDDEIHSPADAIMMQKRKKMADGGMVDLDENAEEGESVFDKQNREAALKENYEEEYALDKASYPDANEDGDSRENDEENKHDMIAAIRKKIKSRY